MGKSWSRWGKKSEQRSLMAESQGNLEQQRMWQIHLHSTGVGRAAGQGFRKWSSHCEERMLPQQSGNCWALLPPAQKRLPINMSLKVQLCDFSSSAKHSRNWFYLYTQGSDYTRWVKESQIYKELRYWQRSIFTHVEQGKKWSYGENDKELRNKAKWGKRRV